MRGWLRRLKRQRAVSVALTVGEAAALRLRPGRPGPTPDPVTGLAGELLRVLSAHGVAILPGYWPRDRCEAVRARVDAHMARHPERVWFDPLEADARLYGLERVDEDARALLLDPDLAAVARAYWRHDVVPGFASSGRVEARPGNRGSGGHGWHRDGVTQQLKALLYLTDVGPEQGPLQVVKGTAALRDRLRHIVRSGAVFRQLEWGDSGVRAMERTSPGAVVTCTGAAGTLVLVNPYAVHRGRPITSGVRYALTSTFVAVPTLTMVAAYYDRQVVQADGGHLDIEAIAARADGT